MPDIKSIKKELPFTLNYSYISESNTIQNSIESDELELIYCIFGNGKVICNNNPILLHKGDIAVINPLSLYKIIAEEEIQLYSLKFTKKFCESNDIDLSKFIYTEKISDSNVISLFDELIEDYNSPDSFSYYSAYHAAVLLLVFITRNYSSKISTLIKNKTNAISVTRAEKIIQYLKDNIAETPSINDLAEQIHISKYYFLHEFKNVTGLTISQVKNILRCRQAKILLTDSNLSLADIAERCGFNNYSYFYTIFKNETGISPMEYRQKNRNISK